ncbi:MAG: glycosyltransferase [Desulfovibrionales bacterium]
MGTRAQGLSITILGLTITSSWGNGHATTFRSLVKGLDSLGHRVTFLERDVPWYAQNRDLPDPPSCRTVLYDSLEELIETHTETVRDADLVMVGSYVPQGIAVGTWVLDTARGVTSFYDIDTPVTLARLKANRCEYLTPELVSGFGIYFTFTGGPTLRLLENVYSSPMARPLYCSVDSDTYFPGGTADAWDLGYMGTYSPDRQPGLSSLLMDPALQWSQGRFVVAGPKYPEEIAWPGNVHRIEHLPPSDHCRFYNSQRFTLNLTRSDMVRAGWSPSVRLFEAAACATPVISDWWEGLDELFHPGKEILVCRSPENVLDILVHTTDFERNRIGEAARDKILASHTSIQRARELEEYYQEAFCGVDSVIF